MHVLVVTQYFWPENFRINDIVSGLHERGHRITVLTGHPNYPSGQFTHGYRGRRVETEQYGGIRVVRVPMLPRGKGSGLMLALNYLSFALSASLLGPVLVREAFDAIFVYEPSPMTVGFPAMAMKRRTRRPLLFYVQDLWPESLVATGFVTSPVALRAVEQMVRVIYAACDQVLVTSRAFTPRVQRLGVPAGRIKYFPQYAEAFYRPLPADPDWAAQRGIPTGFKVMFAGNMGSAQDLMTVVQAAALTPELQWVFVGDGSVKAELKAFVASRRLSNVHFLGSFPTEAMPELLAQADALLVSLTADELFTLTVPAKLQSSLASGRPILASLSGEGADIVRESGAGVTSVPGDPASLAQAATTLAALPAEDRAAMARSGRAYFEQHFNREHLLSELESLLHDAVTLRVRGGVQ